MLVLSRHEAEKILFPELGITLEVVSIKGNTVRIGIDAPREIRIMRGEIVDQEIEDKPAKTPNSNARSKQASKSAPAAQPLAAYIRPGANKESLAISPSTNSAVRESQTGYQVCS